MEESEIKITVEVYTEDREHIQDPIIWDLDSLTVTNVSKGGISFTARELNILWESLYQIKAKSESQWHEIILERKTINQGLSMPPDEWYELVTIKTIQ